MEVEEATTRTRLSSIPVGEDADVTWMPTIGPTGTRKDVTAAVNDVWGLQYKFAGFMVTFSYH